MSLKENRLVDYYYINKGIWFLESRQTLYMPKHALGLKS